ncbi:hypothetical protein WR25_19514 [Diploscapter pachys]|uniref:Uncharacterized protein n=1 Tax=Diploscapter pachys TaxID=2018661 RepID=A0A2A2K043_9BILA|nr:hypothetical protein WR25_19514 [Diploscapter pachys]
MSMPMCRRHRPPRWKRAAMCRDRWRRSCASCWADVCCADAKAYGQHRQEAASRWTATGRAEALFAAATLARGAGMEILGYEMAPDYAWLGGSFSLGSATLQPGPFIGAGEVQRQLATEAKPDQRYHYRYQGPFVQWAEDFGNQCEAPRFDQANKRYVTEKLDAARAALRPYKAQALPVGRHPCIQLHRFLERETAQRVLQEVLDIATRDVDVRAVVQVDPVHVLLGQLLQVLVHLPALDRVGLHPGRGHQVLDLVVVVAGHVVLVGVVAEHEGGLLVRVEHVVGPVHHRQVVVAIDQHLPALGRVDLLQVGGDADIGQLLLYQHGDLLVGLVAGVDHVVDLEPLGTGLLQQFTGLGRVERALRVVGIVVQRAFWNVRVGRFAMAEGHGFHQRLLVDRQVDGLAHLDLAQQAFLMVDEQVVLAGRRVDVDGQALVFLQRVNAGERHEDRRVQFAGLDLEHARVVVGDRDPLHAVQADLVGFPEVGVFLQDHAVAAQPLLDLERAGGHRFLGVGLFADGVHGLFRQDRHVGGGQLREERHRLVLQGHHQGAVIRCFGLVDDLQGERRIAGSQRRAIGELGFANLEGVGQAVVGDFPAFGQARQQLGAAVVDAHQYVVDVGEDPAVAVLRALDRVEGGALLAAADGQHAGGLGHATGQGAGGQHGGGE